MTELRFRVHGGDGATLSALAAQAVVVPLLIGPPGSAGGGGGGGITDGDKGDIVVTGGGAVWEVDPSAAVAIRGRLGLGSAALASASTFALATDLASREPAIAAGAVGQYWRGDKTWVTLDKAAVGLSNVANTAPADLPVSTATATALNAKADLAHSHVIADVTGLQAGLDAKAPLASPALTGAPSAPTAALATNSTQLATTAFVQSLVAQVINLAPGALDTLDELAAAIGDDANFAGTVTTALAGKQPLDATLTALAGLAGGADKIAYFTGTDVLAQADLTAFGRSLVGDANAGAARTTLGLGTAATSASGDFAPAGHVGSGGTAHANATTSVAGFQSGADKTKLGGVATGATANATDAALRDRTTHTGTQPTSSIDQLAEFIRDTIGATLVAGTNVTVTVNDGADTITIDASGGGGGGLTRADVIALATSSISQFGG